MKKLTNIKLSCCIPFCFLSQLFSFFCLSYPKKSNRSIVFFSYTRQKLKRRKRIRERKWKQEFKHFRAGWKIRTLSKKSRNRMNAIFNLVFLRISNIHKQTRYIISIEKEENVYASITTRAGRKWYIFSSRK